MKQQNFSSALLMTIILTLTSQALATSPQKPETKPWSTNIQAGHYTLDASHASLIFKVDHLGFSQYTGSFASFDASMQFDPAKPDKATLTASIDVNSLQIPSPPDGFLDELLGTQWFKTKQHPAITYTSTSIIPTGALTANVVGKITLLGKTQPLTLHVKFNGGYSGFAPYDPNARVGFSARGSLKRSDFGMTYGLPAEGSKMGVGDEVTFEIEAEFSGPPMPETSKTKNP